MEIQKVRLITFSPTGTTGKIIKSIAEGIAAPQIEHMNLTLPQPEPQESGFSSDELALIGAPVYGGRLPLDAIKRFQQLQAKKTPALLVVVYGNRAFEDALLELKELALSLGFLPIAGAAFIGEHSFATREVPIANGRPDEQDTQQAIHLGRKVREKINALQSWEEVKDLPLPGNHPYKERHALNLAPVTKESACTLCGTCATLCPTGAISIEETAVSTKTEACILCCACIKGCPEQARIWETSTVPDIANKLNANCSERKEPEFFGVDG
ncbi:4Fe-4S binding protein [Desulfobulbus rhabdoformis]|uniref:4Fe-4S binding protein n=1 Tax=Desulfobulbus rhabdoformis TaxID=34032 RepID=UPI0019626AEA|nr:4Fe-4S binding protein [Desulfobulbus rhabdoformis]MBM9616663.1 4Fe-4S binding protein [Desulfobulbus rhabdoformis]